MVPWTAGKIVVFKSFCSFNIFILRFDFQNVYVISHLPNFKVLNSKNKNANNKHFGKNLLHIQKMNTKNFCDTFLLKLKLLENCECPGYWKWCQNIIPKVTIPNAKIPNVSWYPMWQNTQCQNTQCVMIPNVTEYPMPKYPMCHDTQCNRIPNAKIPNAVIPNVTYNGSFN